jgi:hypothetical protein
MRVSRTDRARLTAYPYMEGHKLKMIACLKIVASGVSQLAWLSHEFSFQWVVSAVPTLARRHPMHRRP